MTDEAPTYPSIEEKCSCGATFSIADSELWKQELLKWRRTHKHEFPPETLYPTSGDAYSERRRSPSYIGFTVDDPWEEQMRRGASYEKGQPRRLRDGKGVVW